MKVYSERVKRELHFVEGGTPADTYTRPELKILIDENRRQAFTDAELLRIDALKKKFSATVAGVTAGKKREASFEQLTLNSTPSVVLANDGDDEAW